MNTADFVIIGGGAAGMSIAAAAKRARPEWRIVVIEAGGYISYAQCGIPYYIDGRTKSIDDLVVLTPQQAFEKKGVEALIHHRVDEIDAKARKISVSDLTRGRNFEMGYKKLAIATGAIPRKPNFPGTNYEGVFTVRSLEQAQALKKFIEENNPKNAVIIGAGYVGIEMAESLSLLGIKTSVVEILPTILGLYDTQMRDAVIAEGEKNSVSFYLESKVSAIEAKNNRVASVHTSSGEFSADVVILSAGIEPNVSLAKSIGLELGAGGAIYVDLQGHTSIAGIYSAGDCAQIRDLITGRWVWVPLGTTANRQGRAIGYATAGKMTQFRGVVRSAMTKFFDIGIASVGAPKSDIEKIGWKIKETTIQSISCSHYYPDHKPVWVHMYADSETGRVLGGQYVGPADSTKRFDILVAAVANRCIVEDMAYLDIPYAPPFGTVWDPINIAASKLSK
ncbi:FAD-dependent oxidoreductase [bacterium]|nr:FAD-dependent oxidoreductase [bacterium]